MKKILVLFFTITLFLTSCSYGIYQVFHRSNSVEQRTSKIQKLEVTDAHDNPLNLSGNYSFLVISDVHFGAKKKRFDDIFFVKLDSLENKPAFVICLGDVVEHGKTSEYKDYYDNFLKGFAERNLKVYHIAGNHDLYNSGWINYQTYNFPNNSFYYFTINDLSFYFIDTASGNTGSTQFKYLKEAMNNDKNKKMFFSHYPLYADGNELFVMQDYQDRNRLIDLCSKNNTVYFVDGHTHNYYYKDYKTFKELNIPGYLEQEQIGIFSVNPSENKITWEIKYIRN